jgi:quercetin dioxygenase-like cupin family protein
VAPDGIAALGPEGGEHLPRGERHHRVLAELPEYEVLELRFGSEFEGVDPHSHADHVDSFYVLEGEVDFLVGDEWLRLPARSFVAAPPGITHAFANRDGQEARLLNIHAPSTGFHERLRNF